MDGLNDVRPGEAEEIVVAFEGVTMIGKALPAKVGLFERVGLNHGAHGTVDDENSLGEAVTEGSHGRAHLIERSVRGNEGQAQRESMQLIRSKRRSLVLEIHPERGLLVRAPLRMPQKEIDAFIQARRAWIDKHEGRLRQERVRRGPRRYEVGETFAYLGENLTLAFEPGTTATRRPKTQRDGDCLVVTLNRAEALTDEARRSELRESVIAFYRQAAQREFPPRVAFFCDQLGLPMPTVSIAHQRRRWGSCSRRSGLRLNLRLMLCDDALVDYVVAHEVCHLREMNHGPRFHQLLDGLIPASRDLSQRLSRESERYRF